MNDVREVLRRYLDEAAGTGGDVAGLESTVLPPAHYEDAIAEMGCQGAQRIQLGAFWSACGGARLLEDVEYGQWGLVIFDPAACLRRTCQFEQECREDHREGDVVIGRFVGDQDIVIVPRDLAEGLLVALPLDPRSDWYRVQNSLGAFLAAFLTHKGKKYWEAGT